MNQKLLARAGLAPSINIVQSDARKRRKAPRSVLCAASSTDTLISTEAPTEALVSVDSVAYQDKEYRVTASLQTDAPAELVFRVLTDFEGQPNVFHNIETCQVKNVGDRKHVIQTCSWAFLIFHGTFEIELTVEEDADNKTLKFSLLESAFMRQFVGSWQVEPIPHGGANITHSLAVKPVVSPPQKIGDLTKNIFVRQVELILKDLAGELEKYNYSDLSDNERIGG